MCERVCVKDKPSAIGRSLKRMVQKNQQSVEGADRVDCPLPCTAADTTGTNNNNKLATANPTNKFTEIGQ